MKKIITASMVIIMAVVLSACSGNNETTTTDSTSPFDKLAYKSSIKAEYETNLIPLKGTVWVMEAIYKGEAISDLSTVSWKKQKAPTEIFSILDDDTALFGTINDSKLNNARIFTFHGQNKDGFFDLKPASRVGNQNFLDEKVKKVNRDQFKKYDQAKLPMQAPDLQYYISQDIGVAKNNSYVRFYLYDDKLIRENANSSSKVALYSYIRK